MRWGSTPDSAEGFDMSSGTLPITNFTAGEWSAKLDGRVDLARYGQACSVLCNMTILPHGAVTRRMGTEYVAKGLSNYVRLIPFVYNQNQAYVLELTPGRVRFFRDGVYLEGKDIHTGPWSVLDIWSVYYCQSADVMYLASHRFPPQKLSRTGPDEFTLTTVPFASQPAEWNTDSWPRIVTFAQQRLWLSGCPAAPQKIWASKTGDFEDFTTGTDEDAAIVISLVAEQVNVVLWMLVHQHVLLVGTAGGEWAISPASSGAITNKNITASRNSNYGSSGERPIMTGVSILYSSGDGRRLREMSYAFSDDAFVSQDVCLLAEHMFRSGIGELAYCQDPDCIVWCRLGDGTFCGLTYLRAQEIMGWHRHETKGAVFAITCIPAKGYTETWMVVERKNGLCIERMKEPWDGETSNESGCWYVDSGLMYEGSEVTKLTGIDHLEGEEVVVLADGAAHENRVVENGSIELDSPASRVLVGLPYTWTVAPMRLEGLSPRGTTQGKKVRISKVTARLYKSLGVTWSLPSQTDPPYPLASRDVDMAMDTAPLPFSGDAELSMPGGWTQDARVVLSGDGAFPATIIMLVPHATVYE